MAYRLLRKSWPCLSRAAIVSFRFEWAAGEAAHFSLPVLTCLTGVNWLFSTFSERPVFGRRILEPSPHRLPRRTRARTFASAGSRSPNVNNCHVCKKIVISLGICLTGGFSDDTLRDAPPLSAIRTPENGTTIPPEVGSCVDIGTGLLEPNVNSQRRRQ
jgi:hypothetical protein